jgi:hypothetical protein
MEFVLAFQQPIEVYEEYGAPQGHKQQAQAWRQYMMSMGAAIHPKNGPASSGPSVFLDTKKMSLTLVTQTEPDGAPGVGRPGGLILSPVLISGWLGAPRMGLAGAGMAQVLCNLVALGVVVR